MSIVVCNPTDASNDLARLLSQRQASVVVLGDPQLADDFDGLATGPLRAVILAPDTSAVRGVLSSAGGGESLDGARAVAFSAASGRIVDVVRAGEVVDQVRIFQAFARAESQ